MHHIGFRDIGSASTHKKFLPNSPRPPTCPSPASPPAAPLPPLPSPCCPPPRHPAREPAVKYFVRGRADRAREFHPACARDRSNHPCSGVRDTGGPLVLPATPSEKSSGRRRGKRRFRCRALPSPHRLAVRPGAA